MAPQACGATEARWGSGTNKSLLLPLRRYVCLWPVCEADLLNKALKWSYHPSTWTNIDLFVCECKMIFLTEPRWQSSKAAWMKPGVIKCSRVVLYRCGFNRNVSSYLANYSTSSTKRLKGSISKLKIAPSVHLKDTLCPPYVEPEAVLSFLMLHKAFVQNCSAISRRADGRASCTGAPLLNTKLLFVTDVIFCSAHTKHLVSYFYLSQSLAFALFSAPSIVSRQEKWDSFTADASHRAAHAQNVLLMSV